MYLLLFYSHLAKYYSGIAPEQQVSHERTRYKWKFAEKLDQVQMGQLRDEVEKDTHKQTATESNIIGPRLTSAYTTR